MNRITRKGATVEAAISAALQQLNVTRDEVDVEIVEPGKKGFLGFGVREAEVIVSIKKAVAQSSEEKVEKIQEPTPKPTTEPEQEEIIEEPIGPAKEIVEVKIEDPVISDQKAIDETAAYIKSIAEAMGIDDLVITNEMDGKYISFQLESKKAA